MAVSKTIEAFPFEPQEFLGTLDFDPTACHSEIKKLRSYGLHFATFVMKQKHLEVLRLHPAMTAKINALMAKKAQHGLISAIENIDVKAVIKHPAAIWSHAPSSA